LDVLRALPDEGVDAVVTDPPAGISFMGKEWDSFGAAQRHFTVARSGAGLPRYGTWRPSATQDAVDAQLTVRAAFVTFMTDVMRECLRVLKPGGYALVWAIPRTAHWTAWATEDAGFEIRDVVLHLFGSGFPKSLDVSKAIDKAAGAEREIIADNPNHRAISGVQYEGVYVGGNTGAATITAPATDDARQWKGWGTALKPAAEHWILARKPLIGTVAANVLAHGTGGLNIDGCRVGYADDIDKASATDQIGRWPANLILDEDAAQALDAQSGTLKSGARPGGASRFFYVAKAPKSDKTAKGLVANTHPTVKNTELMRWLTRLVTPPGGLVLDPFAGSGSTGVACAAEGFRFLGVERDEDSFLTAARRIALAYDDTPASSEQETDVMIDSPSPPTPFLRWVGSKRKHARALAARCEALRHAGGRYFEPFLGAGAVACALTPRPAMILSDLCAPLGYLWWWILREPAAIVEYAAGFGVEKGEQWNDPAGYADVRCQHNEQPFSAEDWRPSARFLWLMAVCFNGLYRENRNGLFNTPYGDRRAALPTVADIVAFAGHFAHADVRPGWDFEDVIVEAEAGDVIFADPPYDGDVTAFTSYVAAPFGPEAQARLRDALERAATRGAACVTTNADTPRIRDLYAGWQIEPVEEARQVAANPDARGGAACVVMMNPR